MTIGQREIQAIDRWWQTYGKRWRKTYILSQVKGWDLDDVRQEILLSAITKSQGRSRWDPARSNVDAWAGLIGRSRIKHLLDRALPDLPLSALSLDREDGSTWQPEPQTVEWESKSDLDSPIPRSEIRISLGLDPEYEKDDEDRMISEGTGSWEEVLDIF